MSATETTEVPINYNIATAAITFEKKASRLELLVRIVWNVLIGLVGLVYGIVFGIIILVYAVIALVSNVINFFAILITGNRWKTAFNWQAKFIQISQTYNARLYNYTMRRAPYFALMIDKRPTLDMELTPTTTTGGSPA